MEVILMESPRIKRDTQRRIELDKGLRDGLADLCRRRWPTGTAKSAARAFDLTLDQGRSVVAGKASLITLEQVIKKGGWQIVFPLFAEVIGLSAEQYIIGARKANAEYDQRLASLVSNMWPVAASADPASADLDNREGQQRRSYRGGMGR